MITAEKEEKFKLSPANAAMANPFKTASTKGTLMMPKKNRGIQRQRIHTAIVDYLLEDIQSGVYVEGQELPSERVLMEEFAVGRPAIRESLSTLERMGLIDIRPGVRARVRRPTVKPLLSEIKDTLQVYKCSPEGWEQMQGLRLLFELSIVRELAPKITEAQLAKLRAILDQQGLAIDNQRTFAEMDITFHRALTDFIGNPLLSVLAEAFSAWLMTPLHKSFEVAEQMSTVYQAHKAIFHSLEARDPDKAEEAMRAHLIQVNSLYV